MITEANVGFKRLQELLELKDYVRPSNKGLPAQSDTSIELQGACLAWEVLKESKKTKAGGKEENSLSTIEHVPCLHGLDLSVGKGQLVGVAGGVGAGKTSLISAIMGEVRQQWDRIGKTYLK